MSRRSRPHERLRGCADILALQEQPEYQPVRDQEQRHHDGGNEVGGTQLTRCKPDGIALIESIEEIGGAPQVEHPHQGHPPLAPQGGQREQGQDRGDEIAVGSRTRKSRRQLRCDNAGHQECQADKAEAVQDKERAQRVDARLAAQVWPEVSRSDDSPRKEAHRHADSEQGLRSHLDFPRGQRSCVRRFMALSQTSSRSSSKRSLASCGVVNQKPCASSPSSWPGAQPAYPNAMRLLLGPRWLPMSRKISRL